MHVRLAQPDQLTASEVALWKRFQRSNPALGSPFFRPEFTQIVSEARHDVEVAVIQDEEKTVGFFPFQRDRWNQGEPVGFRFSDFQGVIVQPATALNFTELVRGCGLRAWHFDHLVGSQHPFAQNRLPQVDSPYIDLSHGAEVYLAERRRAGSGQVSQVLRKSRKIACKVGSLRFEWHTTDEQAFATLLSWKRRQQQRWGVRETLQMPWVVHLLDRVRGATDDEFSGVLSALFAGDHLIAAHLGIRCGPLLHWWVSSYDQQFAHYSPGSILLVKLIEAAASAEVKRIDLGKGTERYKRSFMSGSIPVAEGTVAACSWARLSNAVWDRARRWIRRRPRNGLLQACKRFVRRLGDRVVPQ